MSRITVIFACACAIFLGAPRLRAVDTEVSASLTSETCDVGETVQFQIKITGARSANPPSQINVDGLSISYSGQSTQVQMNNFNVTMSVVHSYQIVPQRAGKFTIPSQHVEVSGKTFNTNPVTLEVGAGATAPPASGGTKGAVSSGREAFAELVVPKQSAYVGEVIPVELRIYVDTRIRWNLQQPPTLGGQGFTVQKFANPTQNQVTKEGRGYDLVTFKTAVMAAKSGTLTLGPSQLECVANLPRARSRQRSNSPFGNFFDDDAFGDVFGFGPPQQLTIKSDPVEISVQPLPTKNQPKNFSGAVGQFALHTTATPSRLKVGEPLTLTSKITGRGNFDRVSAPEISDERGWRSYPPSGKFTLDDDVGLSGSKTFETALIPEETKTKSPATQFTYFDPLTEKYVMLTGEEMPIVVEGGAAASPAVASASAPPITPAPSETPAPKSNDILYLRTDNGGWGASFEPIYRTRGFWLAQLVPLSALLLFAGVGIARMRRRDSASREQAEWRREKAELMKTLRRRQVSDAEFYDAAACCLRLEAALRRGGNPALVDADNACASRTLDPRVAERVRSIFAAQEELRYAGTGKGHVGALEKRDEVLQTIREYEESDGQQ